MARMRDAGAILLTYKTLFYELVESVEASHRAAEALN
jgi:hypothetical protein